MAELWFYVPDYPKVQQVLEEAYARLSVDDADVTVRAEQEELSRFQAWLKGSGVEGLRIEGEKVP